MQIKQGDSFSTQASLSSALFPDGYFTNWVVTSQIRTAKYNNLIAELTCVWQDATTRVLNVSAIDTTSWPVTSANMDVQFKRVSDGFTLSSDTVSVDIIRDITHPELTVTSVVNS